MKTNKFILTTFILLAIANEVSCQETTPVSLQKVSGEIYQILGGRGANGGLFIGENSVFGYRFKNG